MRVPRGTEQEGLLFWKVREYSKRKWTDEARRQVSVRPVG